MLVPRMDKNLERNNKNKVLRLVSQQMKDHEFLRTKPTIFTRARGPVVEFVHLHKFTFTAGFRVHLGIRVVNETRAGVGLNGPSSDQIAETGTSQRKYDFAYYESDESLHICADRIMDFVQEFAVAWFGQWKESLSLITCPDSPLSNNAKTTLRVAISESGSVHDTVITKQFFGAP